jgi:hypothetical protein
VWAGVAFQQGGQRRIFRIEVHWLDVPWNRDPRPLVYFHLNGDRPVWLGFMRCIFPLCSRTEGWNGMNICYQLWFSVPKTNCSPPYITGLKFSYVTPSLACAWSASTFTFSIWGHTIYSVQESRGKQIIYLNQNRCLGLFRGSPTLMTRNQAGVKCLSSKVNTI